MTLEYEGDIVRELKIKYFDTLPPAVSICVLKTGFLFTAAEFGNHALYQFVVSGGDGKMQSRNCLKDCIIKQACWGQS